MSEYATKIAALLAKAESTTYEEERVSFTEAAERLMVKWGIDDAMVAEAANRASGRNRKAEIECRHYRIYIPNGPVMATYLVTALATGVAPVKVLFGTNERPVWWAIGYPDDLNRVELYVPNLCRQAYRAWRAWSKERGGMSYDWSYEDARRAFFRSFGWAAHDRLRSLFQDAERETTGAELVLRNRKADAEERAAELFPDTKEHDDTKAFHMRAMLAGKRAGEDANIHAGELS